MNREQAIELVRQTFEAPFEREGYIRFLRELLNGFDDEGARVNQGARIPEKFQEYVEKMERVGKYVVDKNEIMLFIVYLKRETSIERARTMQRNFVAWYLSQGNKEAALVAFVSPNSVDWRFSLVKMDYRFEEQDGKTKVREEFTPARRWSFLVGANEKSHTAQSRFAKIIEDDEHNPTLAQLADAFNVEPVTKEFFKTFREIFEEVEATIERRWSEEQKRLYTQRFFNRLLFIVFLEHKGWLTFNGRRDYLRALFEDYYENTRDKNANFHRSRLNTLFFMGLNHPSGDKRQKAEYKPILSLIGDVPYLNGGLFEEEEDDKDGPAFSDAIIAKVLNELVYQFNFTVTESTPLDVEVAVDPEMLGRIFEELVTGRHESGSYYTPKPVVAFMCREALKGYLATALPAESAEGLALFVDKNDAKMIRNPMQVVDALRAVKVCDPACGSGAYLLGMLHELLEQYAVIFAQHQKDEQTIYQTKLDIIQNNLYGVDKDDFAVNIARLRLWLSLIVDFEGGTPPPLPNLDFKIECGDSLTAPDPSGGLQPDMFRYGQVQEFLRLKNEFMSVHAGSEEKEKLKKQIEVLKEKIKEWAHPANKTLKVSETFRVSEDSFDWQVDFAEVFAPELAQGTLGGKMAGVVNSTKGQMEMTAAPKEGGFDIVLANPPYVRQELLGDYKDLLKPIYPEVYNGLADLFVYFYARAHQLLKNGGVSCFISSNKWLKAGYGEKLRQHLLDSQAFKLVVDFGDLPVFQSAIAYPCIFLWQKQPRGETSTVWAKVDNLQGCYDEGINNYVSRVGYALPPSQFGKGQPRISHPQASEHVSNMAKNSVPLGEYVGGKFYRGIVSGLNEAFIVDYQTYQKLIKQDSNSKRLLKPLLRGDNLRKYELHYRNEFYIYVEWECPIKEFPAVYKHLTQYKEQLENRPEAKQGRFPWYAMSRYGSNYAHLYEKPKIIYPVISKEPNFSLDNTGFYGNDKTFFISSEDYYLLGVLNSNSLFDWVSKKFSPLQGGYFEFRGVSMEQLPIPNAPQKERDAVAKLAKQAQSLHTQRRKRVEKFLREIGSEPAESTSRNPLESPWSLGEEEFKSRAKTLKVSETFRVYQQAREETMSLTEEAVRVEKEIDERVKGLYGL